MEERSTRGGAQHGAAARAEGDAEHIVRRALAEERAARDEPSRLARPEAQLAAGAAHEGAGGGVEGKRQHALRADAGGGEELSSSPVP